MKSKLLLLSFLMLLTVATTYAQSSASQAGIAVQGIARDANNTAITNGLPIPFNFTIYQKPNIIVYNTGVTTITPDSFGVFSYVINVDSNLNVDFANKQLWLKIEAGSPAVEISNELLRHVPYAIAANNGVPTGCIMPFVGASNQVPVGWALCDGQPLPAVAKALKALLGNGNAPNLGGMFLRGAGTNTNGGEFAGNDGPILNETQQDGFQSHAHGAGTLQTDITPDHTHTSNVPDRPIGYGIPNDFQQAFKFSFTAQEGSGSGRHKHAINGYTAVDGIGENRPVNYGVNYIIKL
jgi:hypothetical protein